VDPDDSRAADSGQSFPFDTSVLDQLACPACLGALCLDGARLVCAGCGRIYPIVGGIPVLIAERAEPAMNQNDSMRIPGKDTP
jgi:uncharacterized protein YbaR (Trm112 family)